MNELRISCRSIDIKLNERYRRRCETRNIENKSVGMIIIGSEGVVCNFFVMN